MYLINQGNQEGFLANLYTYLSLQENLLGCQK